MTVLISALSVAALVLAICCTVLFAIGAAIELLPSSRAPEVREAESRKEERSFGSLEAEP